MEAAAQAGALYEPLGGRGTIRRRSRLGGGKSDALVIEALRQVDIPYYKAIILRKTFPQLAELIDKTLNYYPRIYPGARYNGSSHTWTFPSGAKILFGSMQYAKDKIKYQGQAYDFIAFDELTHFTWEEYSYLFPATDRTGRGRGYTSAARQTRAVWGMDGSRNVSS